MKRLKNWGLPILSILLTCLFPCVFQFFQNAGEAHVADMLPMLGLYLAIALAAFLVLLLILRNPGRAAVMADLIMLVVMNFNLVADGIKNHLIYGFQSEILLVIFVLLLLGLLVLLFRKKPDMTVVTGLISLAFGVMILMNGALALPAIISTMSYEAPAAVQTESAAPEGTPAPETAQSVPEVSPEAEPAPSPEPELGLIPPAQQVFTEEKRNVYFFIFDEFGGPMNLEHYYGDDNWEFFGALEDRGFSVSRTSKNPESPWTVTLIPNIMNLDYVTSDEDEIKSRLTWLEDPALYRMFRNNGYDIYLINHESFLGETGCKVLARGNRGETIGDTIFGNGLLAQMPGVDRIVEEQVLKKGSDEYQSLMEVTRALKECSLSPGAQPQPGKATGGPGPKDDPGGPGPKPEQDEPPRLTVGYFVMPHHPFAADEHGEPTDPSTYYEWREDEPYLGMLKFANSVILEAVDNIQKNDPEALILMMADHGARKPGHIYNQYGGDPFDSAVESPYMMNVMLCVYDPRNPVDIEGDTCINAARKTFDNAFGLSMGTLPVPEDYELFADEMIDEMEKGNH